MASTGMIIDGVAASEAIDSSGEVLDVQGCDITDLEEGKGLLNWEHRGDDAPGASGLDIVGKIIYARKIFKESDCENDRQKMYWSKVRLPFIYIVARLYDGAGHANAQALAAQIRDHQANSEPILVRYSIEGSTLDRDGNRLTRSVARRVAATVKPCNRTCDSGLVEDPHAPAGFDKRPVPEAAKDVLEELATKKFEHPSFQKLGGATEIECDPRMVETQELVKTLAKLKAFAKIKKALSAGTTDAAPDTLVGGAALQREDLGLGPKLKRGELVRQAMEMFKTYDRQNNAFNKSEFRAFLKHRLPDCDPDFIDRFSDMIEDYKVKLSKKAKDDAGEKLGKKPAKAPKQKTPAKPKAESKVKNAPPPPPPALAKPVSEPLTIRGNPVQPNPQLRGSVFDENTGTLHTPQGSFPMYIPSRDPQPGAREAFHNIMQDPKVNQFHNYAMEQWSKVNKLLKDGKLPPEVVMHATLFSQLSPNTPVPVQELMYAHLVDTMRSHGIDARHPDFGSLKEPWLASSHPTEFPQHARGHFQNMGDAITLGSDSKLTARKKGEIMSFMLPNDKFKNMLQYHQLHEPLVELINRHKDDARSGVSELMEHKHKAALWDARRSRAAEAGKPDPGPYNGPAVPGLAPKTARYTYGMMGGSNVMVPDTHFTRYLFGLEKGKDNASIAHLKQVLWNENNSHILDAIDRYYAKHHDAVKHMREHPQLGRLFPDDESAVFPAFWKNWVGIPAHERARNMKTYGANEFTDHRPFWEAIDPFVLGKSESAEPDVSLPHRTALIHARWAHQYGEVPAMMMYYRHLVPLLLAEAERRHHGADPVLKSMALLIDLKKKMADGEAEEEHEHFQGKKVKPGVAVGGGQKFQVLGEDGEHFIAKGKEGIVRLPKAKLGSHFDLKERPSAASEPAVIDVTKHGIPGLSDTSEQQALVHGVDLKGHNPYVPGWRSMANGQMAYVRSDPAELGWNRSKNEVAYYNAARDAFGLHHYLPLAAAFKHPHQDKNVDMVAVAAIPNAEHMDTDSTGVAQGPHGMVLKDLGDKGELDKLMLMDMIMGNRARSDHNAMFTFQSEPHLRLTDHGDLDGLALEKPPTQHQPAYMNHYHQQWQGLKLHPAAAAWLDGLDMKKLEASLAKSGMPRHMADEAIRRLIEAKVHVKKNKSNATKGSTYMSPWSGEKV